MPRIEVNDIELAYEDTEADGPPVVFVHGLGGSTRVWDAQLFATEDNDLRGIAYDQRGHGRSDKPPGPYSVEQWTTDLIGLLEALELGDVALVGHSVGCMVAEHAAVALGDQAMALAVCGGVLKWPDEAGAVFEQRAELAQAGKMEEVIDAVIATGLSERCRTDRADVTKRMRELLEANDPKAYAEAVTATAAAEMLDPKQLRCPVLAFAGSGDPVTPPSESEAIAAAAPQGDSAIIDGAAHWCMLEDPEGFNSVLFEFLAGLAT
jgi:pimeloyl-ACP methyl ester carboxylesterase